MDGGQGWPFLNGVIEVMSIDFDRQISSLQAVYAKSSVDIEAKRNAIEVGVASMLGTQPPRRKKAELPNDVCRHCFNVPISTHPVSSDRDLSVSISYGEAEVKVFTWRTQETIAIFKRADKRWRCGGPFISEPRIADIIFDLDNTGRTITHLEYEIMIQAVELIATCIDHAIINFNELRDQMLERFKHERSEFFKSIATPMAGTRNESIDDYLYLMSHKNGLTKIGRSKNPKARESTLQSQDPQLRLLFKAKGMGRFEKRLHRIFDAVRIRGEWFDLSGHHIEWIITWCEMRNKSF